MGFTLAGWLGQMISIQTQKAHPFQDGLFADLMPAIT